MTRTPNLPAEGNKDLLGREIKVGDVIAYPVTVGQSAAMRLGKVVDIYNATELHYTNGKDVKVPIPDAYNMKVLYFPESMDWGVYDDPEHDVKYHQESLEELDRGAGLEPWLSVWTYEEVTEGWQSRIRRVEVKLSNEEAIARARKYHDSELRKAKNKLVKGPQPKTLLFPGKCVIINQEYTSGNLKTDSKKL